MGAGMESANAVRERTDAERLVEATVEVTRRCQLIAGRLERLAVALFGPEPPSPRQGPETVAGGPDALLPRLAIEAAVQSRALTEAAAALQGIERRLGLQGNGEGLVGAYERGDLVQPSRSYRDAAPLGPVPFDVVERQRR